MKKFLLSLLVLVIASGALVAQKIIKDPNAEKRNVSGYHGISVSSDIDLYLSQGEESVAVSASDTKYRDRIKTEVKDGILKIWYEYNSNSNINIQWGNHKMKAYVSFKDIDKLTCSGGSDIAVDGSIKVNALTLHLSGGTDFEGKVEADELKVKASGGCDVAISGVAKKLDIYASGGSNFKGYELAADVCNLVANGGSDVQITINKELNANARGDSNVFYKGNGMIRDLKTSGSSSIKKTSR